MFAAVRSMAVASMGCRALYQFVLISLHPSILTLGKPIFPVPPIF